MTIITQNSYFQERSDYVNKSKLTGLINNWAGINHIADSLFKLHESHTNINSFFIHTSKLISNNADTKIKKILKLLSVTLGITHIVLIATLISDLILLRYKSAEISSHNIEDTELVDLWLKEMNKYIDPAILSEDFVQILIKDYIKENDVINREDMIKFSSIVKTYIYN